MLDQSSREVGSSSAQI